MADKYPTHDAGPTNWSVSSWDDTDANDKDEAKPGAGDFVIFTANSGGVTLDEASAALGSFSSSGFIRTLAVDNTLDVDGPAVLSGELTGSGSIEVTGSISSGNNPDISGYTGTLVQNGSSGAPTYNPSSLVAGSPALTVNNNGVTSFVLQASMNMGSRLFTVTAGKFDADIYDIVCGALDSDGGVLDLGSGGWLVASADVAGTVTSSAGASVTVAGHLLITGTISGCAAAWIQSASGNVVCATSAQAFAELTLAATAGVTSTLIGATYAKKLSLGAGTVAGAQKLTVNAAAANAFVQNAANSFTSTSLSLVCSVAGVLTNASPINLGTKKLIVAATSSTYGMVLTGAVVCGDLEVWCYADATYTVCSLSAGGSLGNVRLGYAAVDKGGGKLTLTTGLYYITSLQVATNSNAAENALAFGSSTIVLSGTLNGTGIVCTNTSGVVVGGTVSNVDLTGQAALLHLAGAGSGNTNVIDGYWREFVKRHGRAA